MSLDILIVKEDCIIAKLMLIIFQKHKYIWDDWLLPVPEFISEQNDFSILVLMLNLYSKHTSFPRILNPFGTALRKMAEIIVIKVFQKYDLDITIVLD